MNPLISSLCVQYGYHLASNIITSQPGGKEMIKSNLQLVHPYHSTLKHMLPDHTVILVCTRLCKQEACGIISMLSIDTSNILKE
jgi:hypothetical protein